MDHNLSCDNEAAPPGGPAPLAWFADMVDHCLAFAAAAQAQGRPLVGIMCEFTPREIILAAGAVPVCLCGGSGATIAQAEKTLPSNLCPLIKSTFGYHATGKNPFLRDADLVVAETTCDGKKKMFELMAETQPMHVLELPHKSESPAAFEHWVLEVRALQRALETRFGVTISDDQLREASRLLNRERGLRRQLADLMAAERPPLTGRQLLEFKSLISGLAADLEQYGQALAFFGNGGAAPGSPRAQPTSQSPVRVLLTGVPLVHGAERVLELIESCGTIIVAQENCTGLKPILEDVSLDEPDPLRAIASKYYHLPCSVLTLNQRRLESLRALAAKFRPQCVIELVWQACLTYDIESYHVRKLTEQELGLSYLKITTDYSPSDSARITARVAALVELVRSQETDNGF